MINIMVMVSQNTSGSNMEIKTVQEIIFYLFTLNCMSFMLFKPPFSLSTLISSTLEKLSSISKPYTDIMICFHPQLFIAPYMYLFNQPDGGWISRCTKINTASKLPSQSSLSNCPSDSNERGANAAKDDGYRNFLSDKERKLLERAKTDIKALLRRSRKQKGPQKIMKDDSLPDLQLQTKEEDSSHARETMQKSRDWSIKERYQAEKLAIQKAREDIVRKKYESKKLCRNQIRLLGKDFLEKSLQQGLQIQHQLANADKILRSAQSLE